LFRCRAKPSRPEVVILQVRVVLAVDIAEVALCFGISLLSGLQEPPQRLAAIPPGLFAVDSHDTESALRNSVALFCRLDVPFPGLSGIPATTFAPIVHAPKVLLC
jgi:hypothetical protein